MSKQRINFSTYPQDYYTGAQCRVFFGSTWVDDLATIQYQTSNSKTPLYGYGDHQFRTVIKGQFMVRGSFTVAFKETGYLNSIMNLIRAENQGTTFKGEKSSADTFRRYVSQGYTVEQALDIAANKKNSTTFGGGTPTSDFEDISEVMEDIIWGKTSDKAAPERKIPRSDELDYFKYTGNNGTSTDIDITGFDILLTFGSYREGDDSPEHTMISINDVHITGEALVVSPAGEPLGITYEFFARGLNERVSSAWPVINQKSASNTGDTPVVESNKNNTNNNLNTDDPSVKLANKNLSRKLEETIKEENLAPEIGSVALPVAPTPVEEALTPPFITNPFYDISTIMAPLTAVSDNIAGSKITSTNMEALNEIIEFFPSQNNIASTSNTDDMLNSNASNLGPVYFNPLGLNSDDQFPSIVPTASNTTLESKKPTKTLEEKIGFFPRKSTVNAVEDTETYESNETVNSNDATMIWNPDENDGIAIELANQRTRVSTVSQTQTSQTLQTFNSEIFNKPPLERSEEILRTINMDALPPYVKTAITQLGVADTQQQKHTRVKEYFNSVVPDKKLGSETAWCAALVNWSLKENNLPVSPPVPNTNRIRGNSAPMIESLKSYGQYSNIRTGAIGIADLGGLAHTCFIIGETNDGRVVILGGNHKTNSKVGSGVTFAAIPKSQLIAYRIPK